LLPLGAAAFFRDPKTAWAAGILGTAFNLIAALWLYVYRAADPVLIRWDVLFYSAAALGFTWVNAPLGGFWFRRETPWRVAAAALVSTAILAPAFTGIFGDPRRLAGLADQFEALGVARSGGGPAAEDIAAALSGGALRGGIFLFCAVFWWVSRQLAAGIVRLVSRGGAPGLPPAGSLAGFHAPPFLIWVLSCSLGAILLGNAASLEAVEIGGWNVLAFSGILFLVQGGAVAAYYLRKLPSLLRIVINLGIVILFLKPGVNAALAALVLLLGIAENWVPFRVPKEPPPTPEA
jgi:hypothetical protein